MKRIENITLTEIHHLIDDYFDAKTSEADEELLKRILVNIDVSSPKIDEARAVLGLFAYKKNNILKGKKKINFVKIYKYAAVFAVLALIGGGVYINITQDDCINVAWIGGEKTTDSEIALNILNEQFQDLAEAEDNTVNSLNETFDDIANALNQQ